MIDRHSTWHKLVITSHKHQILSKTVSVLTDAPKKPRIYWRGWGRLPPPPRSRNSSTTWGIAAINHPHSMLGNMPQQLEDSNFLAGLCSSQIIFYFVDFCLNCIFESFLFIFSSVPQFVLFSLSWCLVSRHFSSCYTVLLYMFFGFNS